MQLHCLNRLRTATLIIVSQRASAILESSEPPSKLSVTVMHTYCSIYIQNVLDHSEWWQIFFLKIRHFFQSSIFLKSISSKNSMILNNLDMSSDHVLIKLSDFKEICSDLKRSGDIIKGVLKTTRKSRSADKKIKNVKRNLDQKSEKKIKRRKEDTSTTTEDNEKDHFITTNPPSPTSEESISSNLSSEDGY